ncbi:MAG: methylmalonyl-CoA mutase family protein [Notoacmeibacter sp.]
MEFKSAILDRAFTPATFDDWQAAALKAAKVASIGALHGSVEGLDVAPLSAPSSGQVPIAMSRPNWLAFQRVDDPDIHRAANQAAIDANGGADGLALVFEGANNAYGRGLPASKEALFAVLEHVDLEKTALRIDAHPSIRNSAEWLVQLIQQKKLNPRKLRLAAGIDTASIFASSGRLAMSFEALKASLPQSLTGFFASGLPGVLLEADARPVHNAGGTAAQELAFALSVAVGHLRMAESARQPAGHIAPSIGFALSADQDFALTIAKLRSIRLLWNRVLEACGAKLGQPAKLHVETGWRMMSAHDCETNILRCTIALSAAAFGGADSISILPHTIANGLPEQNARRISRLMQLIARDESHLGQVMDVAAGSGSLEALTQTLCEKAWEQFQNIEREGGPLAVLASGTFQSAVAAACVSRQAAMGESKIIGVNAFQAREPRPVVTLDHPSVADTFPSRVFCKKLPLWSVDSLVKASK